MRTGYSLIINRMTLEPTMSHGYENAGQYPYRHVLYQSFMLRSVTKLLIGSRINKESVKSKEK